MDNVRLTRSSRFTDTQKLPLVNNRINDKLNILIYYTTIIVVQPLMSLFSLHYIHRTQHIIFHFVTNPLNSVEKVFYFNVQIKLLLSC